MNGILERMADKHDEYVATNFEMAVTALLANRGPAIMEVFELDRLCIEIARDGLLRFDREVPRDEQEARWGFIFPREGEIVERNDGAVRKADKDWKLFFHFFPDLEKNLRTFCGTTLNPWQREWFEALGEIYRVCLAAHFALAAELDRQLPRHQFLARARRAEGSCCLRLLGYEERIGVLAQKHRDRAGISQHVYESVKGLCGSVNGVAHEYASPEAPQVLVFPGLQLEKIAKAIKAFEHWVNDTSRGKGKRSAMVFFGKMFTGTL